MENKLYLHELCLHNKVEILRKIIVEQKIYFHNNISNKDLNGDTALHIAVKNNYINCIELILLSIRPLHKYIRNKQNLCPFDIVCTIGNFGIFKLFIDNNYTLNTKRHYFLTSDERKYLEIHDKNPLQILLEKKHIDCIKYLLQCNAFLEIDENLQIIMNSLISSFNNLDFLNEEIKELFINHIINSKYQLTNAYTTDEGYNAGKILIERGYRFDTTIPKILHQACGNGSIKCMKLLLNMGIDVNDLDPYGKSSAFYLCDRVKFSQKLREDQMKILISAGLDVNIQDKYGTTVLHIACKYQCINLIELLLCANADINIEDFKGKTPFHYLCKTIMFKTHKILKMMIVLGCNFNGLQEIICTKLRLIPPKRRDYSIEDLNNIITSNISQWKKLLPIELYKKTRKGSLVDLSLNYIENNIAKIGIHNCRERLPQILYNEIRFLS